MRQVRLAKNFSSFTRAVTAALTQGMKNIDNNNNFNNNDSNRKEKSEMFYLKCLLFAQMNEIDILPDDVTDVKEFQY